MSHPIYSRQQLLNRGMIKVKQVAADLGVLPTGDKRLIQNWVDAIVEHQAKQVQKVEVVEATIVFDDGLATCESAKYHVIVNGEVTHSVDTYQLAERYCKWHSLILVDSQTLAQNELEVELEVQAVTRSEKAKSVEVLDQVQDEGFVKFVVQSGENIYTVTPAHPVNKERCECGDNHFRGTECKHQIAVKNDLIARISFISPSGFGDWEAVVNNEVIGTIEQDFDAGVGMLRGTSSFDSYLDAENYIKDEYVKGIFMGRGSGRITQPIGDMAMSIEDSNYVHDYGQSYTLRVHGVLAGDIFLNDDLGWTLNGEDFEDDWRPVAKKLIGLTRHEYLLSA